MRINRYLANCNIASRRKVEDFILSGCVKVNGEVTTNLSTIILPDDVVEFNNIVVKNNNIKVYCMLNKPKKYITSLKDDLGRKTVLDLIDIAYRIFPVGRLDYNTQGMLILTNDGVFANKLAHPKHEIKKTYEVIVNKEPTKDQFETLSKGVNIGSYITKPTNISKKIKVKANLFSFNITISEGKNRQIRRMMEKVGLQVVNLKRVQIGSLTLGDLPEGKFRYLNDLEIKLLLKKEKDVL